MSLALDCRCLAVAASSVAQDDRRIAHLSRDVHIVHKLVMYGHTEACPCDTVTVVSHYRSCINEIRTGSQL